MLTDEKGQPIEVPAGAFDPALKARIEKALDATIPKGHRFGVVALYDLEQKSVDTQLAVRIGGEFKLVVDAQWDGQLTGFVGLKGSF